jgi:hypothetical protein
MISTNAYAPAVRAVLERLAPTEDPAILGAFAWRLAIVAVLSKTTLSPRKLPPIGTQATLKKLAELQRRTLGLMHEISAVEGESFRALRAPAQETWDQLARFNESLTITYQNISEAPYRERPRKKRAAAAQQIAIQARPVYEKLSGHRATVPARDGQAYGPFLDFIAELFRALDVKESPESSARVACKDKEDSAGK